MLGAATLVVAATGAVNTGAGAQSRFPAQSSASLAAAVAPVAPAQDAGAEAIDSTRQAEVRERAVSRDSRRQSLTEAADRKLQARAEAQAKKRNAALAQVAADARRRASELKRQAEEAAARAFVLPVDSGAYRLTATFGASSGLWSSTHTGLDFAAPLGTPAFAVAAGVVTETGYAGAYGNRVILTLEDGTEVWYCHLNSIGASKGQSLSSGEVLGHVGSTGNSTGPHLHLEVRPDAGDPVDPMTALAAEGLKP